MRDYQQAALKWINEKAAFFNDFQRAPSKAILVTQCVVHCIQADPLPIFDENETKQDTPCYLRRGDSCRRFAWSAWDHSSVPCAEGGRGNHFLCYGVLFMPSPCLCTLLCRLAETAITIETKSEAGLVFPDDSHLRGRFTGSEC